MNVDELARQLHDGPLAGVVYLTGGGSLALSALLTTPGASRTVLEAVVPYSTTALAQLLGASPAQAVSPEVARALAERARMRAVELAGETTDERLLVGVGVTAALATDRPRRGDHHCIVGLCQWATTRVWSLRLQKGRRTREEEETVVAAAILNVLAEAAGSTARVESGLGPREQLEELTDA